MLTQGYGTGALKALQDAGRPVVPFTAFSYNVSAVACAQTAGAKCILGANPAWLSSEAIKLAVEILDTGKKPAEQRDQLVRPTSSPPIPSPRSSSRTPRCRRSSSARTSSRTCRRA